jgi:hypothetical protein
MTSTTAQAILSKPPPPYVLPSRRPSELAYDAKMNRRPVWVDGIIVPPSGSRASYL